MRYALNSFDMVNIQLSFENSFNYFEMNNILLLIIKMYSLAISYLHTMHFDNMHPLLPYTHSCETPPQHILLLFRSFILCHLLSLSKVTCTQAWGVSTMFSCTSTAWILFIEFMIKIGELIFVLVQIFRSDIELNHLKTPFTTSG